MSRALYGRARRWLRLAAALLLLPAAALALAGLWVSDLEAPAPGLWLEDTNGRFVGQLESESSGAGFGYWPLAAVPPRVAHAVLALEDRRFRAHPGVDPVGIARAAWQNLSRGRRVSGGSTLAMQVARMQLDRRLGRTARTWPRKALEAAAALWMTARHGRDAMLAHYLRLIPLANRSHGLAHAAELYFAKPAHDLSWAEIAFLTAIPNAPTLNNPYSARGRARIAKRASRNLLWLHQQGLLAQAQLAQSQLSLARMRVRPAPQRPIEAMHLLQALARERRESELCTEPGPCMRIRLSLDLGVQGQVHDRLNARLDTWRKAGAVNAAAMVVDLARCEVLARVGSSGYFDQAHGGAIDYSAAPRSVGSTLKPFIYALGLARGHIAPDSLLDDLPLASGLANADRRYLGPMLPRQALANSRNLPVVRLLRRMGVQSTGWALAELGLSDGDPVSVSRFGLGLALGVMPLSLTQLMQAYTVFANDGQRCDLSLARGGGTRTAVPLLDPASARLMNLFLSDAQARLPTFKRLGSTDYPFPVALKTGTSQNYRDAWTFAWTPRVLVGVWVGRPDARPMNELGGAASAAVLVRDVLQQLSPGGDGSFEAPRGFSRHALCAYTGDAAGPGCGREVLEWLPGRPRRARFQRVAVDRRDQRRAGAHTPAHFVTVRDVALVPARYRPWARQLSVRHAALEPGMPVSPVASADTVGATGISVISPVDGMRLVRLPGVPRAQQTIALRALAPAAGGESVVWYVNGRPVASNRAGAASRWVLEPGRHRIEARIPALGLSSAIVRIRVE